MLPELSAYLEMLDSLRNSVGALIADLGVDALNWRPLEGSAAHSTNSLSVLAAHIAGAEHFLIGEAVGGLTPTRNRPAEFEMRAEHSDSLVQELARVGMETRAVFANLSATELEGTRQVRGQERAVRWCILHAMEHVALHLGQMQLTLQLWIATNDGSL